MIYFCFLSCRPLQRMFAGLIVMIITFLVAAVVQAQIEVKLSIDKSSYFTFLFSQKQIQFQFVQRQIFSMVFNVRLLLKLIIKQSNSET